MDAETFFSRYEPQVFANAIKLRKLLFSNLPDITEQVDLPARMVAYCYGQKYAELICTLIPSKKGLKLGFNRGLELPDPEGILQGTGKISRYVEIKSEKQIYSPALKNLVAEALAAYQQRMAKS